MILFINSKVNPLSIFLVIEKKKQILENQRDTQTEMLYCDEVEGKEGKDHALLVI